MTVKKITKGVNLRLREDGNYLLNFEGLIGDYGKITDVLDKYNIKVITISGQIDLKCFDYFGKVESINIFSNENFEPSKLIDLKLLKSLKIEFVYKTRFHFPKKLKIEELEIEWNKTLDIQNLQSLKNLTLRRYKQNSFLISVTPKLKHLEIIKGSLTSLDGIEKLKKLKSLTICYLPKLEDFSQITKLEELEYLEFMNCKRLKNIDFTSKLKKLKWIRIGNCHEIESLIPLSKLVKLKGVSIWGNTKIIDNEISITKQKTETRFSAPYQTVTQRIFNSNSNKKSP